MAKCKRCGDVEALPGRQHCAVCIAKKEDIDRSRLETQSRPYLGNQNIVLVDVLAAGEVVETYKYMIVRGGAIRLHLLSKQEAGWIFREHLGETQARKEARRYFGV